MLKHRIKLMRFYLKNTNYDSIKTKDKVQKSQCSLQLTICLGRILLELIYWHKFCETVLEELILTAYDMFTSYFQLIFTSFGRKLKKIPNILYENLTLFFIFIFVIEITYT